MSSQQRPLALITGSTQGIGLSTAQILARKHDYHVILAVRNKVNGQKVADDLRKEGHEASVVELNLDSEQSIHDAVATIEKDFGYLDVLINNAGILWDRNESLGKWELYTATFQTNVIGPGVLTEGLLPLIRKAKCGPPRIVFLSSAMGSLNMSLDKSTAWYSTDYKVYDASKAAADMLAINYARILDKIGGKSNAVCPGLIKTGLTGYIEYGEDADTGATRVVEMATIGHDGPTGTFSNRHGPLPW